MRDKTQSTPQYYPAYEESKSLSTRWRDYLQVVLERKWIMGTVFVAVLTAAVVYTYRQVPLYRAVTRIAVDERAPNVLGARIQSVDMESTWRTDWKGEYINTQLKILQSRQLAERTIKALGLTNNPNFLPGATTNTDYVAALMGMTKASLIRNSRLIDISVMHPDPHVATNIADGLAREYVRYNLDQSMEQSIEAVKWLNGQAREYREKLLKSEKELQDYRERTQSVSLEERQDIVNAKLRDLNTSLTESQTRRITLATEWSEIEGMLKRGVAAVDIPMLGKDSAVADALKKLNDKQIELVGLKERYKDQHPEMLRVKRELKELQDRYTEAGRTAANSIYQQYLVGKLKEESIQQALKEQEIVSLDLNRQVTAYRGLKRNVDTDEQLYNVIMSRMKETSVTAKMETNNIRVVDPSTLPKSPATPDKRRNLFLAVVLGLGGGMALAFLMHFLDDRIKRLEEIEKELDLTVLSIVPEIADVAEEERGRLVHVNSSSAAAESFRTLRASLMLLPAAKKARTLLITSDQAGAGKSMVSSNLGIVFAHNGQKVLIIDADMRRPRMHSMHNVAREPGLSDYLAEQAPLSAVIRATDVPNMFLMPAGTLPPNPSELLGSSRMKQLLADMVESYDLVLVDNPPVIGVSDPLVLLPLVDGVLFVVRFNKSRRHIVSNALQKLRGGDTPLFGAVLNCVNVTRPGYYYYYYYRYGYSYDYYSDGKKRSHGKQRPADA